MAITAPQTKPEELTSALEGFHRGSGRTKSTFATSFSRTTSRMTETNRFSRRPRPGPRNLGAAAGAVRRGAAKRRARRLADPGSITAHRPGIHRSGKRDHRRPADDAPLNARSCPTAGFAWSSALKAYGYQPDPKSSRRSRNIGRLTTKPCSTPTPRMCESAAVTHADRPARRLRSRPDHRRLPAGRPVRGRPVDRAKKKRNWRSIRPCRPRSDPRSRRASEQTGP